MLSKAINLTLAIIIVIMQICGIMVLCGVLVDFGYIYQNEIVLALLLPSNFIFYYLARYYQKVPPRFERWLLTRLGMRPPASPDRGREETEDADKG